MSEIDDDLLQRYYDGELSPVEEKSVRARVEADPKAELRPKNIAALAERGREGEQPEGLSLSESLAAARPGPPRPEAVKAEASAVHRQAVVELALVFSSLRVGHAGVFEVVSRIASGLFEQILNEN